MLLKSKKLFVIIGLFLISLIITSCTVDGFVIFNSGNRVHAIVLAKDNQVELPTTPLLSEHIFYGWFTEEEFTNLFDANEIDEVRRVYAKFIPKIIIECDYLYYGEYYYYENYYSNDSYYYEDDFDEEKEIIEYYTNIRLTRNNQGTYTIINQIIHRPIDSLILPTYYNGIRVTHIANNAFEWRGINELVLPRYIEEIGNNAFRGINVSKLSLNKHPYLRIIGNGSFSNSRFTYLTIENAYNLINISNNAFRDSYELTNVYLLNLTNLKEIGNNAFINSLELNNIIFKNVNPNLEIGNNAFFTWTHDRVVTLIQEDIRLPSWWNDRFRIFGNNTSFLV